MFTCPPVISDYARFFFISFLFHMRYFCTPEKCLSTCPKHTQQFILLLLLFGWLYYCWVCILLLFSVALHCRVTKESPTTTKKQAAMPHGEATRSRGKPWSPWLSFKISTNEKSLIRLKRKFRNNFMIVIWEPQKHLWWRNKYSRIEYVPCVRIFVSIICVAYWRRGRTKKNIHAKSQKKCSIRSMTSKHTRTCWCITIARIVL